MHFHGSMHLRSFICRLHGQCLRSRQLQGMPTLFFIMIPQRLLLIRLFHTLRLYRIFQGKICLLHLTKLFIMLPEIIKYKSKSFKLLPSNMHCLEGYLKYFVVESNLYIFLIKIVFTAE